MRNGIYLILLASLAAAGLSRVASAANEPALLSEQPELRQLLQEEMRAIQKAMATMSRALPQGDWKTLATTARQVHDSFIFQQELTDADRKLLHQTLPPGFIRQDKGFHQRAKKLQQAAQARDSELSLFYYSKMLESCVSCHSRYATHRFPSLTEGASDLDDH